MDVVAVMDRIDAKVFIVFDIMVTELRLLQWNRYRNLEMCQTYHY